MFADSRAHGDIVDEKTKTVIVKKDKKITRALVKKIHEAGIEFIPALPEELEGQIIAAEVLDPADRGGCCSLQ